MYDIYINYFREGTPPAMVSTERKLCSIPILNSDPNALISPIVKTEMGKTGSFEFSVAPTHPYYDAWAQMLTLIRVEYSGTTIFRGRVLTIDNQPMTGLKKIHLEGDYAFLMDSIQQGLREDERVEKTLEVYLQELINNHNSQMNVSGNMHKKIYLGAVPGTYNQHGTPVEQRIVGDTRKYEDTSWRKTSDCLASLQKEFGGYFRTRYESGTCYLDWLDNYFNPTINSQEIELQENLIDLSSVTEVENLFTILLPVGSNEGKNIYIEGYRNDIHGNNKTITVPQIVPYFVGIGKEAELNRSYHSRSEYEQAINNYGIIYTTQTFNNADTQEKLWNYATDWIKNNYVGGVSSFTISALDLHHLSPSEQKFLTGDRVKVIYPDMSSRARGGSGNIQKTLTFISIKYDLDNPDKDDYNIGIPSGLLNKTYGSANKTSKASGGSTISSIGGSFSGGIDTTEYEQKATAEEISYNAWKYVIDGSRHNKKYQELLNENPESAERALILSHAAIVRHMTPEDDPYYRGLNNEVDAILFDGPQARMALYKSAPKQLQTFIQKSYEDNPLDPLTNMTALEKRELDVAADITATEYVSKLSFQERIQIDPRAVLSNTTLSYILLKQKGDRKTMLDLGIETGLLSSNPSLPWERSGYVNILQRKKGSASGSDPYGMYGAYTLNGVSMSGQNGSMAAMKSLLGTQATDSNATMVMDGFESSLKMVDPSNAGNFVSSKLKLFADGYSGAINTIKAIFGLNGSGGSGTIDLDGLSGIMNLRPASSAGTNNNTVEVQASGGKVHAGKDSSGWQITLNEPISYTDLNGNSQTLNSGAIRLSDIQTKEVDSFKTKFAYIDTVVVKDLYAVKAYVDHISANTIHAGTWVRSDSSLFNKITANTSITSPVYYYKGASMGAIDMCSSVITSWRFQENSGTIKLQGTKLNNQAAWADLASFNMAATTFYKNAVAAAHNAGGKTAYVEAPTSTVSPGGTVYAYAWYVNSDGTSSVPSPSGHSRYIEISGATDDNLVAGNIKEDVTIFGVTGTYKGSSGGSVTVDDIQIGNYGNSAVGTSAPRLANVVRAAVLENGVASFTVTVKGTTKYYYMDF